MIGQDSVVEGAREVGMVEIGDKGCVGRVWSIVVVFIINGVSSNAVTVDVDVSSVEEGVAFKVEFGVKVVDPKHGFIVDEMG